MSETEPEAFSTETNLMYLKLAHDNHATVCHMLKTRTQYFYEEFEGVKSLVNFYGTLRDQVLTKIHEIEPPKAKEPAKPYIIDVAPPAGGDTPDLTA